MVRVGLRSEDCGVVTRRHFDIALPKFCCYGERCIHRALNLRIKPLVKELARYADAYTFDIAECSTVIGNWNINAVSILRIIASQDLQHQRGVDNGARHGADM